MSARITRAWCEKRLRLYCELSGQRTDARIMSPEWDGSLLINDESGVKRIVTGSGTSAYGRNIGPGFTSWRELDSMITGMIEAEYLRRYGA